MKRATLIRLKEGWNRFHQLYYPERKKLYASLATHQNPQVLFVTCADSRIEPNFIFQAEPGALFVSRNPGNIVPPHGALLGGASSSLEYALTALSVRDIVVCGHSNCGAMKGLLSPKLTANMPTVSAWLQYSEAALATYRVAARKVPPSKRVEVLAKTNALLQLDHLKTYPAVAGGLASANLRLHAFYYDIGSGEISCYDGERCSFVPFANYQTPAISPNRGTSGVRG